MISPGDVLSLTIEKPAAGGRMIARVDRLVVLVSGAIPGERVRAAVERVGKGVAYAAAVDVEDPSLDRRLVTSDPLCGGCLYAHIAYPRQLELKALVIADAFARIAHLTLPSTVVVASSPERGYRMRARLHVRGRLLGFFREGTHEVCEARQTGQLLPAAMDALERLVSASASSGVDDIRQLEVAENVDGSERVVSLDHSAPIDGHILDRLSRTDGITGVATPHGTGGNVWVTDRLTLSGHPPMELRRHVLAFFQGNRFLLDALVSAVMARLPSGGDVIDLYSGVGLFSVAAAAVRGARVVAVEGDRVAAADLAVNARASEGVVAAIHQPVEAAVGSAGRSRRGAGTGSVRGWPFDPVGATVIVDPPRTGMSREALDGVLGMRPPRLVYVSCDVATLARDARRVVDAGYSMTSVEAFDLFPNTPHVETLAVFERRAVGNDRQPEILR